MPFVIVINMQNADKHAKYWFSAAWVFKPFFPGDPNFSIKILHDPEQKKKQERKKMVNLSSFPGAG